MGLLAKRAAHAVAIVILGCWVSMVGAQQNCHVVAAGGTLGDSLRNTLCVFPFTYKDTEYTECTTVKNDGVPWCSIDAVYNKRWGNCLVLTKGGTVPEGSKCEFPFTYRGDTYEGCTSVRHDRDWCSTDAEYDGNWGNCRDMCNQPGGATAERSCHMLTTGGTAPSNSHCTFPFIYQNVVYSSCTSVKNSDTPWCSLAYDYYEKRAWGNCQARTTGGTVPEDSECVFPFVYRGVTYTSCTTERNKGVYWCSTDEEYQENWGNCRDYCLTTTEVTTASLPVTPTSASTVTVPTSVSPTVNPDCIQTTGGTVPSGSQCEFPFKYKGTTYYDCTTVKNDGTLWCSTTYEYQEKWGNCDGLCRSTTASSSTASSSTAASSTSSTPIQITAQPGCYVTTSGGTAAERSFCKFPFFYEGTEYNSCTERDNNNRPWCYVVKTGSKAWGNCVGEACPSSTTQQPTTPTSVTDSGTISSSITPNPDCIQTTGGTVAVGSQCVFPFKYKDQTYYDCTTVNNNGRAWCSTTYEYEKKWGNCDGLCQSTTAAPVSARPGCVVVTSNGPAPNGSYCDIPFSYKGTQYNSCTDRDYERPWCYVIPARDREWGICNHTFCPSSTSEASSSVGSSSTQSTASTTDSGPCENGFKTLDNTLSYGGDLAGSGVTADECKQICRALSGCLAVDYTKRLGSCFTHTSPDYTDYVKTDAVKVQQFRIC